MRLLACLLLALPAAAEPVHLRTSDQIAIAADLHRVEGDAPTVICLPMYKNVRGSYEPLVKPLLEKGLHVLVLDLRGHGDSTPALAPKVVARDPELFSSMHRDVEAAVGYLRDKGFDTTRIALVGAGVGCSVAVDFTVRHPGVVRSVVLLSPAADSLGGPTREHLESWPGTRWFVLGSSAEKETTAPVIGALPAPGVHVHFDVEEVRGTRMLGKRGTSVDGRVEAIEDIIAGYMEGSLRGDVDFVVPQWTKDDPVLLQTGFVRRVPGVARKGAGVEAQFMAWAVGDKFHFGIMVDRPFKGRISCELDEARFSMPFDTAHEGGLGVAVVKGNRVACPYIGRADGKTWMEFHLGYASELKRLAVTLEPEDGEKVRFPGVGSFALRLRPQ